MNMTVQELSGLYYDIVPEDNSWHLGVPTSTLLDRIERETGCSREQSRFAYWHAVNSGYIVRVPSGVVRGRRNR